jgi:hypothetical protein
MYGLLRGLGSTSLATAIFRQEGSIDASGNWVPTSLGYRLNNPGNLNYAGQPGATPTTSGNGQEAQFSSMDAGIAATNAQLALDASRGLTIQDEFTKWATGNQGAYIQNVSDWTGYDPSTSLSTVLSGGDPSLSASAGQDPGSIPLDTSSVFDFSGASDGSGSSLSTGLLVALGIAGIGLLWAALG